MVYYCFTSIFLPSKMGIESSNMWKSMIKNCENSLSPSNMETESSVIWFYHQQGGFGFNYKNLGFNNQEYGLVLTSINCCLTLKHQLGPSTPTYYSS